MSAVARAMAHRVWQALALGQRIQGKFLVNTFTLSRRVPGSASTAHPFHVVHGLIRAADDVAGAGLWIGKAAEAETGLNPWYLRVSRQVDRLGQLGNQCGNERQDGRSIGYVVRHDEELIATEPCDSVALTYGMAQTLCHNLQHMVTGLVAVGIVYRF